MGPKVGGKTVESFGGHVEAREGKERKEGEAVAFARPGDGGGSEGGARVRRAKA